MITTTIHERLVGWGTFEELASSIKQLTFGELVKLATPVLKRYHSDLWHDAKWLELHLQDNAQEGVTWYYATCDSGTAIGTERSYIAIRIEGHAEGQLWRCRIMQDGKGAWYFNATDITDEVR